MTIIFTDEEWEWLEKIPRNFQIKAGCPDEVRVELERKLALLGKEQ